MPSPSPNVPGVIPYLLFEDSTAAIDFYRNAFAAEEVYRQTTPDGRRTLHAQLRINDGTLYMSDDMPEFHGGQSLTPAAIGGTPVELHMNVASVDEVVERARSAGATVTMDPEDMFWGERFAKLTDPFGYRWTLSSPGRQFTEAEQQAELQKFFGKP